ncbi:OLA1 protein [Tanacetum coccineum]
MFHHHVVVPPSVRRRSPPSSAAIATAIAAAIAAAIVLPSVHRRSLPPFIKLTRFCGSDTISELLKILDFSSCAFENPDIIHVDDIVDPDIEFMERRNEDLEMSMKRSNDKQLKVEHELCLKVKAWLESEKVIRFNTIESVRNAQAFGTRAECQVGFSDIYRCVSTLLRLPLMKPQRTISRLWNTSRWKKKSAIARQNRLSEVDGQVSKHTAGSITILQHKFKMMRGQGMGQMRRWVRGHMGVTSTRRSNEKGVDAVRAALWRYERTSALRQSGGGKYWEEMIKTVAKDKRPRGGDE